MKIYRDPAQPEGGALADAINKTFGGKDTIVVDETQQEATQQPPAGQTNTTGAENKGGDGNQQQNTASQEDNNTSSLNSESEKGTQKETAPPSFENLLAERSGGKFKTWEEIQSQIDAPRNEFSNEFVKTFNEFAKDYADPKQAFDLFVDLQANDFEKMQDVDVLYAQLEREYPNLASDQLERLFQNKYRVREWSEDNDSPNEIQLDMNVMIAADATKARQALKDLQKKVLVESKKPDPKVAETERVKQNENWKKEVDNSLSQFDKVTLKIAENQSITMDISKEELSAIKEMSYKSQENIVDALLPFFTDNGKFSHKKLAETFHRLRNFDKAIALASENAYALGQKNVAKDLKNINMTAEHGTNGQQTLTIEQRNAKSIADTLAKQ